MIVLVTGSPGAGKSYYAVRTIAASLMAGKPVATNIELVDGWERRVANTNPINRLMPWKRRRVEAKLRSMLFVSADLDELFRVRLAGKGEGRGIMVLDEAHTWLNARTWDTSDREGVTKADAVKARLKVVRFFSAHRHLGWDVYCITQDAQNIDRQVRSLFEYHARLKNLKNFKVAGLPVVPIKYFLAIWVWNDGAKSIVKRQGYPLTRIARIYRTHALSDALDLELDGDLIPLPRPMTRPPAETGEAGPAAAPNNDDQADEPTRRFWAFAPPSRSDQRPEAVPAPQGPRQAAEGPADGHFVLTSPFSSERLTAPSLVPFAGTTSDAPAKVPSPMDPAVHLTPNADQPGWNRADQRSDADAAATSAGPE